MREWAPGDRVKSINWRASARRGVLWVNEQHPERNTDVVLFLDTFTDVSERDAGRSMRRCAPRRRSRISICSERIASAS